MKNPSCSKCLKKFMKIKRNDGGDEGDRTFLSKNSFATPPNKSNTGRGFYRP